MHQGLWCEDTNEEDGSGHREGEEDCRLVHEDARGTWEQTELQGHRDSGKISQEDIDELWKERYGKKDEEVPEKFLS